MAQEKLVHLYEMSILDSPLKFYQLSWLSPDDLWLKISQREIPASSFTRLLEAGAQAHVALIAKFDKTVDARFAKSLYLRQPEQNLLDDLEDGQTHGPIRCIVCHLCTLNHSGLPNEMICDSCKKLDFCQCSGCFKIMQSKVRLCSTCSTRYGRKL